MDDWENLNDTSLPEKIFFLSLQIWKILRMQITRIQKEFEIKRLGEHHDFYGQSDTLLLADVFEKFKNMCLKIYELDRSKLLSAPRLSWQEKLKVKVKSNLSVDTDTLLMVEQARY